MDGRDAEVRRLWKRIWLAERAGSAWTGSDEERLTQLGKAIKTTHVKCSEAAEQRARRPHLAMRQGVVRVPASAMGSDHWAMQMRARDLGCHYLPPWLHPTCTLPAHVTRTRCKWRQVHEKKIRALARLTQGEGCDKTIDSVMH